MLPSHVGKSGENHVVGGLSITYEPSSIPKHPSQKRPLSEEKQLHEGVMRLVVGVMAIHPCKSCNTGGTSSLGPGHCLSAALAQHKPFLYTWYFILMGMSIQAFS